MSRIIILKGISREDFIAADLDSAPFEYITVHEKIPEVFTDIAFWLTHTNLKCWSCGLKFACYPKFIPVKMRDDKKSYDIKGVFCKWPCAVRGIYSLFDRHRWADLLSLLHRVAEICEGRKINIIHAAPVKTIMRKYKGAGGCSDAEFCQLVDAAISMA